MAKPVLPPFLERSPKQVADDERAQELRRASFTRSKLTPEERAVSRGAQIEEIARANIMTMEEKRAHGHTNSKRGGANLSMLKVERSKLAHGLAQQGRYAEAATIHPSKRMKAHYKEIHEAIERSDDEECDCPPKRAMLNEVEIELPRTTVRAEVYSRHHGRMVDLEACCSCPHLNARPSRGKHAELRAARAGQRAVGDVELLRR